MRFDLCEAVLVALFDGNIRPPAMLAVAPRAVFEEGYLRRRVAKPVTAGVAIEVPLITAYALSGTVEITPTPGPVQSSSRPILLNCAMKFFLSVP